VWVTRDTDDQSSARVYGGERNPGGLEMKRHTWILLAVLLLTLVAGCGSNIGVEVVRSVPSAQVATGTPIAPAGTALPATPASVLLSATATSVPSKSPTKAATAAMPPTPTPKRLLTLNEALAQGLVEAQFRGTGSSSGDSIMATLTRSVPRTLEITVPPGMVLASHSPSAQDMVVLRVRGIPVGGGQFEPASTMRLTSDDPKEFLLEAYCLDFDRDNPSDSTGFSVGEPVSSDVQAVLEALQEVPLSQRSMGATQAAIWAVTDNLCESELRARFPVDTADLEAAASILAAAGIDASTTCLFGGRNTQLPTASPASEPAPTPTTETGLAALPTSTSGPAPTPVRQAGTPVAGPVWKIAVRSVARMTRLECGFDAIHRIGEGYELLEVVVEFSPIMREEEMSVTTEKALLIDSDGAVKEAVGGGHPTEEAVMGRRSDNCGVSSGNQVVVLESFLIRDTLTTSFFFLVDEGSTGYSFQYLGYPPIALDE